MTDEEMAEEYAIENWEHYEEGQNDSKALEQAYLAGVEFGYNKCNERLIKAKNLLTRFIMGSVYFNGKETDLVEEAEQFLRELEE